MSPNSKSARPHVATLGLGGNIGDPPASMAKALRLIDKLGETSVSAVSRLYRTPPWGKTDQDWFFNCCARIETGLDARGLLDACLDIEKQLKRWRRERWGPRIIDIDVLTFDDVTISEEGLVVPHPFLHERAFVLLPLLDIIDVMRIKGRTIGEWAAESDSAGIEIASDNGLWWKR